MDLTHGLASEQNPTEEWSDQPLSRKTGSKGDGRETVIVVGSGVIGLSAAIALVDAGYRVKVITSGMHGETVSSVVAAFWTPFHVEGAQQGWARRSLEVFRNLEAVEGTGVRSICGNEYFKLDEHLETWMESSWWRAIPAVDFHEMASADLPRGFTRGVEFTVPVIDMKPYLRWLERTALQKGVTIHMQTVESLHDLAGHGAVVVNATGLGAHRLVRDRLVYGCLGQVVCIKPVPAISRLLFMTTGDYEEHPTYIVPLLRRVLLGGTTFNLTLPAEALPDPAITRKIINKCSLFVPELASLRAEDILEVKAGLRPCRERSLRLQLDVRTYPMPVVHAYGHGGAGVTLSWGTAEEVVRLVDEALQRATKKSPRLDGSL